MSIKENNRRELLDYLKKLHAGQIYVVAHKRHILDGLGLCRHATVGDVCWSDDCSVLNLEIRASGHHEVAVCLDGQNLKYTCDCKEWSPQSQCPHVVCVLALLKKAVSPEYLTVLDIPGKSLKTIRSLLLLRQDIPQPGPVKVENNRQALPKSRFCLVLDKNADSMSASVTRNGVQVTSFALGLSFPARVFLQKLPLYRNMPNLFEEFFLNFGKSSSVLYRDRGGEIPLAVQTKPIAPLLLHLDLADGQVRVTRTLEDGGRLDDTVCVTEHFLVDPAARKVYRFAANPGWRFWKRIDELSRSLPGTGSVSLPIDSHAFSIEPELFYQTQLPLSETEKNFLFSSLRFYVEGREVHPVDFTPSYRLHARIGSGSGEVIEINAEVCCEELSLQLSTECFRIFSAAGLERVSPPLRTKKRTAALYEACFDAVGKNGKDLVKMLRLKMNNGDFTKRAVRLEFKKIVEAFAYEVQQKKQEFFLLPGGWALATIDRTAQAKLLEIPGSLFGSGIFSQAAQPGCMHIPKQDFLRLLPALNKKLEEKGFSLFYEDKPVTSVRWDFVLDATSSSLDWFEIRPEIRCGGDVVGEEEFARALQNGGFIDNGSSLHFLDEASGNALALFAGLGKRQGGDVVRIPRLQILDWLMLRNQGIEIKLSPTDARIMDSLLSFDKIPPRKCPAGLKAELRHYQLEGYAWLGFLYEHRFGGCLADDMGLGKTVQAISLLAGLNEGEINARYGSETPHLIVVPPSILFNWENEISRFYPGLKVALYRGPQRSTDFSGFDVVLTSFDIVRRDIDKLKDIFFHVMIFDEAQSVKNIHSETTSAVRRLRGDFRLALTGTPVENHLGEYYSIMELAVPGLLGNPDASRQKLGLENQHGIAALVRKTKPFILRRSKQMIVAELPPKIETDMYLELTPKQKALYTRTVAEVRRTVDEAYRDRAPGQARIIALTAILKLRQICLATRLLLPETRDCSPKIDFLVEQLKELMDEGHSVLVFSQFTTFLNIVEESLTSGGIKFSRLDGSTPVAARRKLVTDFQSGKEPSAFLLSLKAGGRGLNLTKASYVFHLDPWWNPAVENQASDRAHRIGQTSRVNIVRLLMRHTVEEKMMALKEKKLRLYKALLEDAETGGLSVSKEDFYFLLDT
jgi:superfamily II DNA or RNA helicase